ncbi:MAG: c-type cytochrome [Mycobacterium sp.]
MKKVILAVLALAFALFLALPNLAWSQEDVYKAKCAGCHGADGNASTPSTPPPQRPKRWSAAAAPPSPPRHPRQGDQPTARRRATS